MRIDDLNRTPLAQGAEQTGEAAQNRAADKAGVSAAGSDQANVSDLAHALSTRDPQRLEQLHLEVQSGKYSVSPQKVANAIIEAHLTES
jgi:anti-sigma28 factor (negative regulator of flagellin synthesis)